MVYGRQAAGCLLVGTPTFLRAHRPPSPRMPGASTPASSSGAYNNARNVRLTKDDAAEVSLLAKLWRCTEAEGSRRTIRVTAKREGVTAGAG
jgi:hypothetical protein